MPARSALPASPPLTIRRANTEDSALLAQMGEQTFRDNFGHLYSRENLENFLQAHYGPAIQHRELQAPNHVHFLAYDAQTPVGFAKLGPCKLPVEAPAQPAFELHRLYVIDGFQSRRVGGYLMEAVLQAAQALNAASLYLGVWENNLKAQTFYRRHGFAKVAEYDFPVGTHRDREHIYQHFTWPVR